MYFDLSSYFQPHHVCGLSVAEGSQGSYDVGLLPVVMRMANLAYSLQMGKIHILSL